MAGFVVPEVYCIANIRLLSHPGRVTVRPMPPRPNLLFILTDQQMAATLGCYGSNLVQTPHLDALARDGVLFNQAYAACPICTPARASLQTGLMPFRHGMQTNIYTRGCLVHELPDHPTLLPRLLRTLGYRPGFTGKWHLGFGPDAANQPEYQHHIRDCPGLGRVPLHGSLPSSIGYEGDDFPGHGGIGAQTPQYHAYLRSRQLDLRTRPIFTHYPETFEVLSGTETTVSHFLTEQASAFITERLAANEPFYYQLNYWGPHSPYHASTEFLDLYRDLPIPPWPSFDEDLAHKPSLHHAHRTETTRHWTWSQYETALRVYFASITELDAKIGRLISLLKQNGQYERTLIVFSSDHGDSLGVHRGLTDKALFMYEETNRIPLLIKPPEATPPRAGQTENRFVGTCDLYSTFLDYAGLSRTEAELDGRSLRPLIEGESVTWRDCIVTECTGLDYLSITARAIRYQNFKYVFNPGDLDELYDLFSDPHELRNLAIEPASADLLLTLREKLDQWMVDQGDGLVERYRRLRRHR